MEIKINLKITITTRFYIFTEWTAAFMNLISACIFFLLYTQNQHALVNMKKYKFICLVQWWHSSTSYYNKLQSFFLIDCGGGEQVKKQNYFDENHYLSKLNNLIKNRRFYDDKILINGILYIRNMRLKQSHRFRAYSRKCLFSSSRYLWLVLLLILISLM